MIKSDVNISVLSIFFTAFIFFGFYSSAEVVLTDEQLDILSICEQQLDESSQSEKVKVIDIKWKVRDSSGRGFGFSADVIYEGTYKPYCLLPVGSDGKLIGQCPPEEMQLCKTEVFCFPKISREPKIYSTPSMRCGPAKMEYQ